MITADTITDEQIRALRDEANRCNELACSTCYWQWRDAEQALSSNAARVTERNAARARCAEILNARAETK